VDCARLLLEHGADGTARMDMGWTPAHCAAEAGKLACLRVLHHAGVSVCNKDKYKDKPIDVAKVYNHTDCVNFLQQLVTHCLPLS
jgi:ankyrin repeat protein